MITGTVSDARTGDPIPGVQIKSGQTVIAQTNSAGEFSLNLSGSSVLTIQKANYRNRTVTVTPPQELKIALVPVLYRLNGIQVLGRSPQQQSLDLATDGIQLDLQSVPERVSMASAMTRLPGVSVKSYGGPAGIATISVHGGQGDRLAVLLDGVSINNEQTGNADISQIPAGLVNSLEFHPYGASVRFGQSAMTGAVNIQPRLDSLRYSLSIGSENSVRHLLQWSDARGMDQGGVIAGISDYLGCYDYKEKGDYNALFEDRNFEDFTSSIRSRFGYGWYQRADSSRTFLRMSLMAVHNQRRLSGYIYGPAYRADMDDDLVLVQGLWTIFNHRHSTSYKLSRIRYSKPPVGSPGVDSEFQIHTLNHNIEWQNDCLRLTAQGTWIWSQNEVHQFGGLSEQDVNSAALSLSGEYRQQWDEIFWALSVRTEADKSDHFVWAGQILAERQWGVPWSKSVVTVSRNYRKPSFNDLYWEPFGDANLDTEISRNCYITQGFLFDPVKFELRLFYIDYDHLIQWRPQEGQNGLWKPENVRQAVSEGGTVMCQIFIGNAFQIDWNYARTVTRKYDENVSELHDGKPILYTPEHTAGIHCLWTTAAGTLGLQWQSISNRIRMYGQPDLKMPSYQLVDLQYSVAYPTRYWLWEFTASVENLQDLQIQSVFGYPEPGRTFMSSVTVAKR